jgi:hypothetical protein
MAKSPSLTAALYDARLRVTKAMDAERAGVAYSSVPANRPVCMVEVDDFWVQREQGSWVVAYRLVLQNGRLVIGELRIYPKQFNVPDDDESGVLSPWDVTRDLLGVRAWAPPGGLTASIVHGVALARDVNVGRLIMRLSRKAPASEVRQQVWEALRALGVKTEAAPAPTTAHRKGGPPGKSLDFYRRVAKVYLAAEEHPVRAVARALAISITTARAAVHRARHRHQLLPPTSPGRAGGNDLIALQRIAANATRGEAR